MSEKAVKSEKQTPKVKSSKGLTWAIAVIAVVLLEAGGIAAAVKLTEARNQSDTAKLHHIQEQLMAQGIRLETLEKMPAAISTTSQQLDATAHAINVLSENFDKLYNEVGNSKVPGLEQKVSGLTHQVEVLEENRSNDNLILSLALIIKENALYHKDFTQEANVLADFGANNDAIKSDIEIVNLYKGKEIADNKELSNQFMQIIKDFNFKKIDGEPVKATPETQQTVVAKAFQFIKDMISGMHFDKVVVLKKEKKTSHQRQLLNELTALVGQYKFSEALQYIKDNGEFSTAENKELENWQIEVRDSLAFNNALSHIVSAQLNAMREDISNNVIKAPAPQIEEPIAEEVVETPEPQAEEPLND